MDADGDVQRNVALNLLHEFRSQDVILYLLHERSKFIQGKCYLQSSFSRSHESINLDGLSINR